MPSAAAANATRLTWLAAGDSYASGQGLPDLAGKCARAKAPDKTWAQVAQESLDKAGYDFSPPKVTACTGATTAEFFRATGKHHPAEWTRRMGRFDLVTLSFGGDNVGFATVMAACITRTGECSDRKVRARIKDLGRGYPGFLNKVADEAAVKDGHVLVMGYPALIEDPSLWPRPNRLTHLCQTVILNDAKLIRGWAGDLNATIGAAVTKVNAEPAHKRNGVTFSFVDVVSGNDGVSPFSRNLFEPAAGTRHELCSPGNKSWLNGLMAPKGLQFLRGTAVTPRSLHPTQTGENAMGNLAAQVIGRLVWPSSPTLGLQWSHSLGLGQHEGYGSVEPATIQNGIGPTSYATGISWESWGGMQAVGSGQSSHAKPTGTTVNAAPARATIVAFDPGTCHGHYAYKQVTYYFPEYAQHFTPTGWAVCPPTSTPPTSATAPAGATPADCPSTTALMAAWDSYPTSHEVQVYRFTVIGCWRNWVVGAITGNGNGTVVFGETGGLHVVDTATQFAQFDHEVCTVVTAPQGWTSPVVGPANCAGIRTPTGARSSTSASTPAATATATGASTSTTAGATVNSATGS